MSFEKKNVYATVPDVTRGKPFVLSGDPKGKTFLYAHGNSIVVRDIEDPLNSYLYTEHSVATTVAKYAPSGFYIASADISGKVRIWDTTQETHILKYEYQPLSGAIKDLAWSEDSKRIVVCGEGREICAHAFLWDSGSSVGELSGHSKAINSIDFKQSRPYRVVTASEDTDLGFYAGPPFKLQHLNHEHERFVNCVRYAPDGSKFLSGGADGKAILYDGKDGKKIGSLGEKAHEMGIYGVSWSPDSKQAITASADKTVKLWDIETQECVTTFTFGDSLDHQQLGCLWQGEHLLSVQLNGHINYLDRENPSKPKRIIKGSKKSIVSSVLDREAGKFYAGSYDGRVSQYDIATGDVEEFTPGHTNSVLTMALCGDNLLTASIDDTVAISPKSDLKLNLETLKLDSQARGVGVIGNVTVIACQKEIVVLEGDKKATSSAIKYESLCAAVSPNGNDVAVGGDDGKIHVYSLDGTALSEKTTLDATGPVLSVAYSPDGAWLASGDKNRNVYVFETSTNELKFDRWKYHTAKVDCLAWTPDSQHLASGSLDTNIIVWALDQPMRRISIKGAHPMSGITSLTWSTDTELFSTGADGTVRSWTITHLS